MSPDYEYWRAFAAIKVWEIACMMQGFDPRWIENVVDEQGDGADLSVEERMIADAVLVGDLTGYPVGGQMPSSQMKIGVAGLLPWLTRHGYHSVASALQGRVSSTLAPAAPNSPVSRTASQEAEVLTVLKQLGHTAQQLPKNPSGTAGVKSEVRKAMGTGGVWAGTTVFDKAWERLRKSGAIAYSS